MTYANHSDKSRLAREYAKMRTIAGTANERLRTAYERQANEQLQKAVEAERANFQRQLDDYKAYAQNEIDKAWREAEHWRAQVEIIYGLLEDQTRIAEDALKRLAQYETVKPIAEVVRPIKPKHKKGWSDAVRRRYEGEGNESN